MIFRWCTDASLVPAAVALLVDGLTNSYISHSELQSHRAIAPDAWSPDIAKVFETDLRGRLSNPLDAEPGQTTQIFGVTEENDALCAVFLVTFSRDAATPFAVLEDIVVSPGMRGVGLGGRFMDWFAKECLARDISRQFLESGGGNNDAHHFFETHGFRQISIVMMNELT